MTTSLAAHLSLSSARRAISPISILGSDLLEWWSADSSPRSEANGLVTSLTGLAAGLVFTVDLSDTGPSYSATGFNGAPELTFAGVFNRMVLNSQPFPSGSNPCEIWGLVRQAALPADTGARCWFSYGGDGINNQRRCRRTVVSGVNRSNVVTGTGASNGQATGTAVDFSSRHTVRVVVGAAATNLTTDGNTTADTAAVPDTGTSRVRLGAASDATAGQFWQGGIRDVLVTAPLSTEKAAWLTNFLNARR